MAAHTAGTSSVTHGRKRAQRGRRERRPAPNLGGRHRKSPRGNVRARAPASRPAAARASIAARGKGASKSKEALAQGGKRSAKAKGWSPRSAKSADDGPHATTGSGFSLDKS